MHRLNQIEGLRGYLALSVLLTHLIHATGYDAHFGPLKDLGGLAVKCFMIISGFVIFFLVDIRHETYRVYITRRFFRIYPVFLLLFALSIPFSIIAHSNFINCARQGWFTGQESSEMVQVYNSMWQNIGFHIPAHLFMVHGLIPDPLLPNSSVAFLGPAWSLSLEWQFYLVAPLWIYFLTSESIWKRSLMYSVCLILMLVSRRFLSLVQQGAALPYHVEFFFLGLICYYLYRSVHKLEIKGDTVFPSVFILCMAIYKWSNRDFGLFPFLAWFATFALILEPACSVSSRYITPLFTNRISMWLGKISFSIYLCHMLVIYVVQWCLLKTFPGASQMRHFLMLSLLTFPLTVLVSAALYFGIEAPFIKLGKRLTHESP